MSEKWFEYALYITVALCLILAGHAVINAKNDESRKMAIFLAFILGIIPAWQTISVWDQAGGFNFSSYSGSYGSSQEDMSEAGRRNSRLP